MENQSNKQNENELFWQREIIKKLLLDKKPNKTKKWPWVLLIIILIFIIFIMPFPFMSADNSGFKKHIATLDLSEEISDMNQTLEKLTNGLEDIYYNQKNVQAIIIRANSPGGSPVTSDIAYQEIQNYKKKYPKIPIYAVVSDVCASGCYYIISATDKIYANPSSIVGSIGVIMPDYDLRDLANKLGIKDRTKTAGRNKALGSPFQEETPEQIQILNSILDQIHNQFINAVKQGRSSRLKWEENPDVFTGRIFTGIEAKDIGLIDDFGSIYSVARSIMEDPVLIDYTPEDDWIEYIQKTMRVSLEYILLKTIGTNSSFK
ncbi:MAG: signal peptide peptidase SppA [Neisseriaceae bacterium]|nr:MAG: signal peptide peptidase SppA [Neisseriaceae bacterium]